MAAVDRQLKIVAQLGLHRRQKDVSNLSLAEYVHLQELREQQQQEQDQPKEE
jgi:hypothetical protein